MNLLVYHDRSNHKNTRSYNAIAPMYALNRVLILTVFSVFIPVKREHVPLTQGSILEPITWIRVKT